jgi:hypothetical protein
MHAQSRAEVFHSYIDHLHALIERLSTDRMTIDRALTTSDHLVSAIVTSYMNGLGELREQIAGETEHLQGLMHALEARNKNAKAALLGSY